MKRQITDEEWKRFMLSVLRLTEKRVDDINKSSIAKVSSQEKISDKQKV